MHDQAALGFALEAPLPSSMWIGRGSLLLLRARLAPDQRPAVREIAVSVDGQEQRFAARGRLRLDYDRWRPYIALSLPVRLAGAYGGTTARLRIETIHAGGRTLILEQAIDLEAAPPTPPPSIGTPIAICLATYNPNAQLLARQIESLRAQTRRDWTCLIHDDGSKAEHWAELQRLVAGDARFRLHRSERNRGFYRNFEAALALVPTSTPFVALCDQDDDWYPDKLAASVARLEESPRAQLVYTDMRIVDRQGVVRSPTYWSSRRNNYRAFDTLLIANTVTGAASLFRGSLLEAALPFPPEQGVTFHDHWLACVAFAAGGLEYIDRPLYDYTQHVSNVIGHSDFSALSPLGAAAQHAANLLKLVTLPPFGLYKLWCTLGAYHFDYRRLAMYAETLRLRFPALPDELQRALALFDDSWARAYELMLPVHLEILRRGDTTNMAEFSLGLGLLLHRTAEPALTRLATRLFALPARLRRYTR